METMNIADRKRQVQKKLDKAKWTLNDAQVKFSKNGEIAPVKNAQQLIIDLEFELAQLDGAESRSRKEKEALLREQHRQARLKHIGDIDPLLQKYEVEISQFIATAQKLGGHLAEALKVRDDATDAFRKCFDKTQCQIMTARLGSVSSLFGRLNAVMIVAGLDDLMAMGTYSHLRRMLELEGSAVVVKHITEETQKVRDLISENLELENKGVGQ